MATNVITPNEEAIFLPGYGDIKARSITIASVHFQPRNYDGFFHSKNRNFYLAPGSMGKPAYRKVWDSQQWCQDTAALHAMQAGMDRPEDIPHPVAVTGIVTDLLTKWQPFWSVMRIGNLPQLGRKPDVGIIAIAGDIATPEEIHQMDSLEAAHCRSMVEEADRFHRNGSGEISDYHRDCLKWLGSEKRDWYAQIEGGHMKKSPISGNRIPMEALADQGIILMDFYIQQGLDPADFDDEFVVAMWKKNPNIRATIERRLGLTADAQASPVRPPANDKK